MSAMVEVLLWAVASTLVVGGLLAYALCKWIDSMLEDSEE